MAPTLIPRVVAEDDALQPAPFVDVPAGGRSGAQHRHPESPVADLELAAVLGKLLANATHQGCYGGPGPLGRKAD